MNETGMQKLIDEQEEKIFALTTNAAEMSRKLTEARVELINREKLLADANAEIETLKAQIHRAELAGGWTPASEPPDDNRDVILRFPDLSEAVGWYSLVIGSWVLAQGGMALDIYLDAPDAVQPVAWKELEA